MKTKKTSSLVGRVQDSYTYGQGIEPFYGQSLLPFYFFTSKEYSYLRPSLFFSLIIFEQINII